MKRGCAWRRAFPTTKSTTSCAGPWSKNRRSPDARSASTSESSLRLSMRQTLDRKNPIQGRIDVAITRGVVTLAGEVPSLAQKRLAGALAWWVSGTRDVIDTLGVQPPEEDSDDAICDAVRLVLDRDPAVHAAAIQVGSRDGVVTFEGTIPAASEHTAVEHGPWCVWGVRHVVNHLTVRA